ncbi:MAG: malate dehydrogenase [Isosphaeraceae bacterium]|jgi:malate dehydrogenase|nr:MAG: malate dehydrogenase [Isosphaeraceae bacterium]
MNEPKPIQIAVTGAGGQIGYALIFRIASGAIFGPNQKVALRLLEITPALPALTGTLMELEDCAFPLLADATATDKPEEAFAAADWVILVGGLPRKDGMSRADLIRANGPIFTAQGKAINDVARPSVRVLTVANPCNTNALIAKSHAPDIPPENWFAMTRLDQNRAASQLAKKAGVPVEQVSRLAIWGNHSDTQVPDYQNARIGGRPVTEVITDHAWLESEFIPTVAKRGAAVIKARGASSAASAANAAIDSIRSLTHPTARDDCFSAGVWSRGDYGVPTGLIFSFPLRTADGWGWNVASDFQVDAPLRDKIMASARELETERDAVKDLLGPAL